MPEAPSRQPQYQSLQAGRGIAALMVVITHIGLALDTHADAFRQRISPEYLHLLRTRISGGAMGVEFFFVLSGIVILTAHRRDVGQTAALPSYIWKRFRRIFPFYWVVLPIWILLNLRFSHVHDPAVANPLTIFSNIVLVHIGNRSEILLVAWTLFHEVLFYLVFALAIACRRLGMIVLVLWILASASMLVVHPSPWCNDYLLSPLHLLFGWGMLIAHFAPSRRIPAPLAWLITGVVLFSLAVIQCSVYTEWNVWVRQLAGLGAALALASAMQMEQGGTLRIPSWLVFMGDASYAIYLVHLIALLIGLRPAIVLWSHFHVPLPICMIGLFLFALVFCLLTHVFVEKPLLRLFRTRSGQSGLPASDPATSA